jgi:hypothetical protein
MMQDEPVHLGARNTQLRRHLGDGQQNFHDSSSTSGRLLPRFVEGAMASCACAGGDSTCAYQVSLIDCLNAPAFFLGASQIRDRAIRGGSLTAVRWLP